MQFSLSIFIIAIAGSIAKPLYASSVELFPRYLSAGNEVFNQYKDEAPKRLLNTKIGSDQRKTPPKLLATSVHTILPRGNCAGKPCEAGHSSPQGSSDQRPTGRKSGGLSFSFKKSGGLSFSRKKSTNLEKASRQSKLEDQKPGTHSIEQNGPVGPSRTEHIQRKEASRIPIPYPNFLEFDRAASYARPSRNQISKEFKNPSEKPMSMRFTVHGPGTVSLTSEHENSYKTESHNVKQGESLSRDIKNKYGTRVQGITETGAQFDLAAQRASMAFSSQNGNGLAKTRASGPDDFSRTETVTGRGRSEIDLKSHANQQFVNVDGTLEGKGGFHAHTSAGIPLE